MYEERRPSGFGKTFGRFILIVLIVFLIVGFFPTKQYVKQLLGDKLGVSENQVFNSNLNMIKDAAISYYSGDRLPSKESTLTLKEMIDKNLLVDVKDSNNKSCNLKKSYVKAAKSGEEYKLEINLVCTDKKGKIITYFGSYDYCTNEDVCAKKKLTDNSSKADDSSKKETSSKTVDVKEKSVAECQYSKVSGGYYNYSNWSDWSTNAVSASNTTEVQTKTVKEEAGTIQEKAGTKVITQNPKKVTATKDGKTFVVYVCPSNFDNGGTYNTAVLCKMTVDNYVTKTTYKNVIYYRYRSKYYVSGNSDYKWSNCDDKELINKGYKLTGQTR